MGAAAAMGAGTGGGTTRRNSQDVRNAGTITEVEEREHVLGRDAPIGLLAAMGEYFSFGVMIVGGSGPKEYSCSF